MTTEQSNGASSPSVSSAGLAACPCGKQPDSLLIAAAGHTCKYAFVAGDCCGEWMIEFRTDYYDMATPECLELARKAWNRAPRLAANASLSGLPLGKD